MCLRSNDPAAKYYKLRRHRSRMWSVSSVASDVLLKYCCALKCQICRRGHLRFLENIQENKVYKILNVFNL